MLSETVVYRHQQMEKIAVIGIGRLGLCLALNLEKAGYKVFGVDCLPEYVNQINLKELSSEEPQLEEYLKSSKNFIACTTIKIINEQDIDCIFVVLPTPSNSGGGFDHSSIEQVADDLMKMGKREKPHHLIINSTTMPGYCDGLQRKLIDYNYLVSYNPEFIAQGTIIANQQFPDQVLIGEASKEAGDKITGIYQRMCKNEPVFCRMQPTSAEITKLATNCFLTTKIAFANAIGDLALMAGAEPEKILEAIGSDSRIGNKFFKYGFGYGGPCFPRDNRALAKYASNQQQSISFAETTDKANNLHHQFLLQTTLRKHSPNDTILVESVTYKKGTTIIEESQQLKLAVDLAKSGRKVKIKETTSVINQVKALYGDLFFYEVTDGK